MVSLSYPQPEIRLTKDTSVHQSVICSGMVIGASSCSRSFYVARSTFTSSFTKEASALNSLILLVIITAIFQLSVEALKSYSYSVRADWSVKSIRLDLITHTYLPSRR